MIIKKETKKLFKKKTNMNKYQLNVYEVSLDILKIIKNYLLMIK